MLNFFIAYMLTGALFYAYKVSVNNQRFSYVVNTLKELGYSNTKIGLSFVIATVYCMVMWPVVLIKSYKNKDKTFEEFKEIVKERLNKITKE